MSVIHPARRFDFDDLLKMLRAAIKAGLVYEARCPQTGLSLFCYTNRAVYDREWSYPAVVMARGLILDVANGIVVATPFPKFHNYGEFGLPFPDIPFEVFEKLDGSMVSIFHYRGRWRCATKGAFQSPQAEWAENWLDWHRASVELLEPGTTYLAEAIYPENRIVIDYGGERTLKLLAAYDRKGCELPYDRIRRISELSFFGSAMRVPFGSLSDLIAAQSQLPASEEGFVIRFSDGNRLKMKGDAYKRVHRFISNVRPLPIWHMMAHGKPGELEEARRSIPEEFWIDFDNIVAALNQQISKIIIHVGVKAREWSHLSNKEVAARLNECDDLQRSMIFAYRNQDGDLLSNPKSALPLYGRVRPDRDVLEGYTPSTSIDRVLAEAA